MNYFQNQQKYFDLRIEYPSFTFENYTIYSNLNELNIEFHFSIGDKYHFKPNLAFPIQDENTRNKLSEIDIRNLVFHIGMIELLSYWKASCSPQIIIKPHRLTDEQIKWWKKLYHNGLGEFFFINGITTNPDTFVEISADTGSPLKSHLYKLENKAIIPIGGGKDSIVTLELLKRNQPESTPMILNMNPARERTILNAGYKLSDVIVVQRSLDPKLLELNELGFLNGHTPFSALLAFVSLLTAALKGHKYIALSNESSANESTVAGTNVNHQYSKSYEFESDFRQYTAKYLSPDLEYFSFLRPLNELQIAKYFSKFESYFPIFRSCNVGSKTDEWCGKCSKCLFTYIILSPFLSKKQLWQIFKKDLLEDAELVSVFDQLTGIAETKPFECVGTFNDVNGALLLTLKKYTENSMPILLKHYKTTPVYRSNKNLDTTLLLKEVNPQHYLNPEFLAILNAEQ